MAYPYFCCMLLNFIFLDFFVLADCCLLRDVPRKPLLTLSARDFTSEVLLEFPYFRSRAPTYLKDPLSLNYISFSLTIDIFRGLHFPQFMRCFFLS